MRITLMPVTNKRERVATVPSPLKYSRPCQEHRASRLRDGTFARLAGYQPSEAVSAALHLCSP
jgi:hypothetical protein